MPITIPVWLGQPWFPGLLKLSVKNPLLLPVLKDLLKYPAEKLNPFVTQNSLSLVANLRQNLLAEGISERASKKQ